MLARRALLGLIILAPATLAAQRQAVAAGAPGTVSVDVSRLVLQGLGPNAVRIKSVMERELSGDVRAALQRSGNALSVSVRGINMVSYSSGGCTSGGGSNADAIESIATVTGRDGRVVGTWPILSQSSASAAGPWYAPDIDARRIDNLARTNAGWIRRYVGA